MKGEIFMKSLSESTSGRITSTSTTDSVGSELDSAKRLIANVAHDLKTPLSSFMVGVESLKKMLEDVDEQLDSPAFVRKDMKASVQVMKDQLLDVINTNTFMLMTINRCIDYAKASSGLKLQPKYETLHLLDTIHMPIKCMRSVQSEIAIELQEVTEGICSHVITDKGFLQENLLCLLSNAVKYSDGGSKVEVKVTLQQHVRTHSEDLSVVTTNATSPAHSVMSQHSQWTHTSTRSVAMRALSFDNTNDPPTPTSHHRGMVCIEVIDNGIGVPLDMRDALFHPFKQTMRLAGGTGLGLYSLAQRMEAVKGGCGVRDRDDGKNGAVFFFQFPYKPDYSLAANNNTTTQHSTPSTFPVLEEVKETSPSVKKRSGSFNLLPLPLSLPLPSLSLFSSSGSGRHQVVNNDTSPPNTVTKPPPQGSPSLTTSSSTPSMTSRVRRVSPNSVSPHLSSTSLTTNSSRNSNTSSEKTISSSKEKHVLLVDDSPLIVKITRAVLQRQGYHVTTVSNGLQALHSIDSLYTTYNSHYDCILLDFQLPVLDGLETCRRIRSNETTNHSTHRQVIIGLSANDDSDTLEAAMSAGFDAFLPKPFQLESFEETLKNLTSKTTNHHN